MKGAELELSHLLMGIYNDAIAVENTGSIPKIKELLSGPAIPFLSWEK